MPRRNINAQERTDKKWSKDYINQLMKKLRAEQDGEKERRRYPDRRNGRKA